MAQLGGACNGETGHTTGNQPGNQRKLTGNTSYRDEVAITPWWCGDASGRPLVSVFRFKNKTFASQIAQAMINACSNPNIGYDTENRGSFTDQLKKIGFTVSNISKVNIPCETDCSALVSTCFRCATNVDFGLRYIGDIADAIRKTGLCDELTNFTSQTRLAGDKLQVGDICLWRGGGLGHTAIVVSESTSTVVNPVEFQAQTNLVLGLPNVIVCDEDKNLIGQTELYTLKNTKGSLTIKATNDKGLVDISKIVAVDNLGVARLIWGFKEEFQFAMVGDSRTVQLGKNILSYAHKDYDAQYGLIPDENIFAEWGGKLVNYEMTIRSLLLSAQAKKLAKSAAQAKMPCANFWFGINDIQTYQQQFLGNRRRASESVEDAKKRYVEEFVTAYKDLINIYMQNYDGFDKKTNRIYITSIVSTSKDEQDYFDEQGNVIKSINEALKEWVIEEAGDTPIDEWLNYVEINKSSDIQAFVSDSDFIDRIHFTKKWFETKFIPNFNFTQFAGEIELNEDGKTDDGYYPMPSPTPYPNYNPPSGQYDFTHYGQRPVQYVEKRDVYNYFRGQGKSSAFAVGIMGNIRQECNFNFRDYSDWKTDFTPPQYSSFGLCQWHNTRWENGFQAGFGKKMWEWCDAHGGWWEQNWKGQLSFLLISLDPANAVWTNYHFSSAQYAELAKMVHQPNTLAGAKEVAKIFVMQYEQPGNMQEEIALRQNYTEEIWKELGLK